MKICEIPGGLKELSETKSVNEVIDSLRLSEIDVNDLLVIKPYEREIGLDTSKGYMKPLTTLTGGTAHFILRLDGVESSSFQLANILLSNGEGILSSEIKLQLETLLRTAVIKHSNAIYKDNVIVNINKDELVNLTDRLLDNVIDFVTDEEGKNHLYKGLIDLMFNWDERILNENKSHEAEVSPNCFVTLIEKDGFPLISNIRIGEFTDDTKWLVGNLNKNIYQDLSRAGYRYFEYKYNGEIKQISAYLASAHIYNLKKSIDKLSMYFDSESLLITLDKVKNGSFEEGEYQSLDTFVDEIKHLREVNCEGFGISEPELNEIMSHIFKDKETLESYGGKWEDKDIYLKVLKMKIEKK